MTETEYLQRQLDNANRLVERLATLVATMGAPAQQEEITKIFGEWGQVDAALDNEHENREIEND